MNQKSQSSEKLKVKLKVEKPKVEKPKVEKPKVEKQKLLTYIPQKEPKLKKSNSSLTVSNKIKNQIWEEYTNKESSKNELKKIFLNLDRYSLWSYMIGQDLDRKPL